MLKSLIFTKELYVFVSKFSFKLCYFQSKILPMNRIIQIRDKDDLKSILLSSNLWELFEQEMILPADEERHKGLYLYVKRDDEEDLLPLSSVSLVELPEPKQCDIDKSVCFFGTNKKLKHGL